MPSRDGAEIPYPQGTITKDTVHNASSSVGKMQEGSIRCDAFPDKANGLVEKFDPCTRLRPFITTCSPAQHHQEPGNSRPNYWSWNGQEIFKQEEKLLGWSELVMTQKGEEGI